MTCLGAGRCEAVDLAMALQPDVVVKDIAMPAMTGVEATRQIRALAPCVRVLVLTVYANDQYIYISMKREHVWAPCGDRDGIAVVNRIVVMQHGDIAGLRDHGHGLRRFPRHRARSRRSCAGTPARLRCSPSWRLWVAIERLASRPQPASAGPSRYSAMTIAAVIPSQATTRWIVS